MEEILTSMVETMIEEIQEGNPQLLKLIEEAVKNQIREKGSTEGLEQIKELLENILEGE